MKRDNQDAYTHINRTSGVAFGFTRKDGSRPTSEARVATDARKLEFLVMLRATRNVREAREALGIPKGTISNWRVRNPVFAVEMDMAMEEGK